MRIVLLTHFYPPEIRTISSMMRDVAETLTAHGHTVTVLTTVPTENVSDEDRSRCVAGLSNERDVKVVRLHMPSFRRLPYVFRGLVQLVHPYVYWRAMRQYASDGVDVIIVYTPPLPLARVGMWAKRRYGAKFIFCIQDIFPQNAIDLGILRQPLLIRFFERMENRAYAVSDMITTHTEGGRQFLIARKGIVPEKVTTVSNWVDTAEWTSSRAVPVGFFRTKYGLEDKFVFLYPGIFGPSQHIDFLLNVAKLLHDDPRIAFLFIGDGVEKNRLAQRIRDERITNVHFHSFVSPEQYPLLVQEMNVGLMSLSMKNTTAVVPGKLVGFMAARKPVVAFLHPASDGHRVIREARCGWSLGSDNVNAAADLLRSIVGKTAELREYGQNGYDYVQKHFSKDVCIGAIERLL